MPELNKDLIEKALALCLKEVDDMFPWMTGAYESEYWDWKDNRFKKYFSYPHFYAYLLSKPFIEKYYSHTWKHNWDLVRDFWEAIYEFQKWNHEPLTELLKKI